MTYDFDIRQMLDAFDGDPEKLANAFANSLNEELASNRSKKRVDDAAAEVACAWEEFVDEYFAAYPDETKGLKVEDYYITDESPVQLMYMLIKLTPYISLFTDYMTKLNDLADNVKETAKPAVNKAVNTGAQVFENTMKKFFKENNI